MVVGRDGEFFLLDFRWKPDRSRSIVAVEPLDKRYGWRESTLYGKRAGRRGAMQAAATELCRRNSTPSRSAYGKCLCSSI